MAESADLLFDTGALIDIYRGHRVMRPKFQAVLERKLRGYLSIISEAELWRGVRPMETERHEAILSYFTSIGLDSHAARLAGEWMRRFEPDGLGWMDALIAATGKKAGLTVLTRDARLAHVLAGEVQFEVYPVS